MCVPGIPSDQSSGTSSPLCDSGLHLNYHPNNTVCFPSLFLILVFLLSSPRLFSTLPPRISSSSSRSRPSASFPRNCRCPTESRLGSGSSSRPPLSGGAALISSSSSAGHAVVLVLAHVTGAALGEEMGGPSPYPTAALAPVPLQPGFRLLQVGGCQVWAGLGSEVEIRATADPLLKHVSSTFTLGNWHFCAS